jgi:hypothetical protein
LANLGKLVHNTELVMGIRDDVPYLLPHPH